MVRRLISAQEIAGSIPASLILFGFLIESWCSFLMVPYCFGMATISLFYRNFMQSSGNSLLH